MIAALARATTAFQEPKYAEAAKKAAVFILKTLRNTDGALMHRYRDRHAGLPAHVDDYAFFIWGLLELYQANFDVSHLDSALQLNDLLIKHYWDESNGGFFFTSDAGEDLLVRTKEIYDGAIPSGNSVAMLNLLRLARITGNTDLEQKASRIARIFSNDARAVPSAHTQFYQAVDFAIGPSAEVVVAGNSGATDTRAMIVALQKTFLPNCVVLLRPTEEELSAITKIAGFTASHKSIDGRATAYVCRNQACDSPTTDIEKMLDLLSS
jgi:hypothetical protein